MPRLLNHATGEELLASVKVAKTFWTRLVGLQLCRHMAGDAGLWIAPCSSLHTCFMRFPIDVIMLDRNNIVLGTRRNVRPWRALLCVRGTAGVIETNVGAVKIAVGTRVVLTEVLF